MIAILAAVAAMGQTAAVKNVAVRDDFYSPKSVSVSKGSRVKWVWKGDSIHNVKVTKGPVKFSSKLITNGSYAKKLTRKGTYRILCTVHAPDMKMTVRVR